MELVVLAYYLAKTLDDTSLRDRLVAGEDVHMANAKAAIGDVKYFHGIAARDVGKKITYSLVYGGGAPTISEQLGIPENAARQAVEAYHKNEPGLRRLQAKLEIAYRKKGYIKTLHGRNLRCDSPHKLPNMLIQGSCAEIMKRSLVKIHRELGRDPTRAHLVAAIHDEFAIDTPEEDIEHVTLIVPQLMRDMKIETILPLDTDCEISYGSWADKKEYDAAA